MSQASVFTPMRWREGSTGGTSGSQRMKMERKASNSSSHGSAVDNNPDKNTPRRVSITKASNLTVALSGGNPKSKQGVLRRRSHSVFASFREVYMVVDDGTLSFQQSEDDVEVCEEFSLLSIREIRLVGSSSSQFQLRIIDDYAPPSIHNTLSTGSSSRLLPTSWTDFSQHSRAKNIILRASSNKEAMEWIATIKHELKNQILVCKNMLSTLQSEGHPERAEPLFDQIMELLRVVYDCREHFEIAETLRMYGKWLESQGRHEEAAQVKRQAKAIKRRCEEGLDSSLSRASEEFKTETNSPTIALRRLSSLSAKLPPLKKLS